MKKDIGPLEGLQMLDHGPTVIVAVRKEADPGTNLFAVSWIIPCSEQPPLLLMSVNPRNYSHELINRAREFTVNIPNPFLLHQLHFCGVSSGRKVDKAKKLSLTLVAGKTISTPLVEECIGHLECKVTQQHVAGDHTIFVAEVAAASVNEGLFEDSWSFSTDAGRTLHYLGDRGKGRYAVIGPVLQVDKATIISLLR